MTEEYLRCPHCRRLARHRVARERVPAVTAWCSACYAIWLPEVLRPLVQAWRAA